MAIATQDDLAAAYNSAQQIPLQKASITAVANFWYSLWAAGGNPGAGSLSIGNTTTGVVPDNTTAGAPSLVGFGGNTGYLAQFQATSSIAGRLRLYDRIYHIGSISLGTLATTSFSAQPSYRGRLPADNSDGVGAELWIEIAVANGATNTLVTVEYSDHLQNPQTATLDANLNGAPINRMLPMRLAAGSRGIFNIRNIIVSGATGTGSVNIVVMRPLAEAQVPLANVSANPQDFFALGGPRVYDTSCLAMMLLATTTSTGTLVGSASVING